MKTNPICYEAYLDWVVTEKCNLNCEYCLSGTANKKPAKLFEVNIPALLESLNKAGKVFKIVFSGGGEPFLVPNIIETSTALSKKHYLGIVTNLTSNKVLEFAEKVDPGRVLEIFASLHYKELAMCNLLEKYASNFLFFRKKGFNIKATMVAYPGLTGEVENYIKFFNQKGIEIIFYPFLGEYKGKKYPVSYLPEELELFRLSKEKLDAHSQFDKICNAGYNTALVFPNGDIRACLGLKYSLGNIYKDIKFRKDMSKCPLKFCACPLKTHDADFFETTVKNYSGIIRGTGFLKRIFRWK